MSRGEFGKHTPREISALLKEYEEVQKREDARHAVVVTELSNLIRAGLGIKERREMADFFVSLRDPKGNIKEVQPLGEMKAAARTWAAIFGGKWTATAPKPPDGTPSN